MAAKKKAWVIRLEFEVPDPKWAGWIDIQGGINAILNLVGINHTWHISKK